MTLCDWCGYSFGASNDLRIPYDSPRSGRITVCEGCAIKLSKETASEFLYEIAQRIDVARDAAGRKAA